MTLVIHTRDEWGAAPPSRAYSWIGPAVAFTCHWVGPGMGSYSQQTVPSILRGIQSSHMTPSASDPTKPWSDIAYSFAVDRFGGCWTLRGWDVRTAANGTNAGNSGSIAVVYLGGEGDPFTDQAKATLVELRAAHLARGGLADCYGHTDWTATGCPGAEILTFAHTQLALDLGPAFNPTETPDMTPEQAGQLAEVRNAVVDGHVAGAVVTQIDQRLNVLSEKLDRAGGVVDLARVPTTALLAELGRRTTG